MISASTMVPQSDGSEPFYFFFLQSNQNFKHYFQFSLTQTGNSVRDAANSFESHDKNNQICKWFLLSRFNDLLRARSQKWSVFEHLWVRLIRSDLPADCGASSSPLINLATAAGSCFSMETLG